MDFAFTVDPPRTLQRFNFVSTASRSTVDQRWIHPWIHMEPWSWQLQEGESRNFSPNRTSELNVVHFRFFFARRFSENPAFLSEVEIRIGEKTEFDELIAH